MKQPTYPSLYQINTRVWLTELSSELGRRATLDDIPDVELDRLAEMGFDWIWFLSVWCTGELGRKVSREHPDFRRDFEETLPIFARKILLVQDLPLRITKCILTWVVMKP